MHRLLALIVGIGLALGAPGELRAESGSGDGKSEVIALVAARISGDADPALRGQMQQAIRAGLESAGLRFMGTSELRKALGGIELLDCTSQTCLQQISDKIGAKRFLRAHVEANGASYSVDLELLDIAGKTTHKLERSCAVCTMVELNEFVGKMAGDLLTAKPTAASPVILVTQPTSAKLTIDGKAGGVAPYSADLAPGTHTIVAEADGYTTVTRTIEVTASSEALRFEFVLVALHTDRSASGPRPMKHLKWISAAGAAVALITGGVLLSIDGNATSCGAANEECAERYSTTAAGTLSLLVGAALGGTSAWMFLRDRSDARSDKQPGSGAGLVFKRGGAVATFTGRF